MKAQDKKPEHWYPSKRSGHLVGWVLLVLVSATLLTNAYYLQFLEPAVSRKMLASILVAVTAIWFLVRHFGIPTTVAARRSFLRLARTPILLLGILLVAFSLRYQGIESGLPQSYIPDEYDYVHSYLQMIKRGDMNPHWWHHPSIQPYVNVAAYLALYYLEAPKGRWDTVQKMQVEDVLFWGRFAAGVVPGTLAVLAVFFLARRLFGSTVGLVASSLVAVVPGLVEIGQYNKPDSLLVLFCTLSVSTTLLYLDRGGRGFALAAGALVGLTVAVKYNGALVLLPFLVAVSFRNGLKFFLRPDVYLGAVGVVVGFTAGCPYFYADLGRFIDEVGHGLYAYGFVGLAGAEGVDNWFTHASYTVRYGAGLLPFAASLLGLGLALYRIDRRLAVFLTFPVLYYSFYSSQKVMFAGNLMPVYPFFAILAAYGVVEGVGWLAQKLEKAAFVPERVKALPIPAIAFVLVLPLLLRFPVTMTARWNHLQNLPDTGNIAAAWIEGHYPPNTSFAVERHTPVLDPSKYRVHMESRLINRAVRDYRARGVQYLIVSETVYDRFGPEHRQTKNYRKLFEICPEVKQFLPEEGKINGPTIKILQVPAELPAASD